MPFSTLQYQKQWLIFMKNFIGYSINIVTTLSLWDWRLHEFCLQIIQFCDPYLEPCNTLIDIGSFILHVIYRSVKTGIDKTSWKIKNMKRAFLCASWCTSQMRRLHCCDKINHISLILLCYQVRSHWYYLF